MKGIIIAGGTGSRFMDKKDVFTGGKHLISIAGRPLISYHVMMMRKLGVSPIIIVGSPLTTPIYQALFTQDEYSDVEFVTQSNPLGVAQAITLGMRTSLHEKSSKAFVILGDCYSSENVLPDNLATVDSNLLFLQQSETPYKHAVIKFEGTTISKIIEKPTEHVSNTIVAGMYVLDQTEALEAFKLISPSQRGEYEIGTLLNQMLASGATFELYDIPKEAIRMSVDTINDATLASKIQDDSIQSKNLFAKSKKPVLFITGIAGFIGSRIAVAAIKQGYKVFGVDNLSTGYLENISTLQKGKDWFCLDITERTSIVTMSNMLTQCKVEGNGEVIVVHTACPAYDAQSHLLMSYVTHGVVVGTVNIIAASIRARIGRFINFSSMARYEMVNLDLHKETVGYEEDDPIGGMTPYGNAKVAAERIVRDSCNREGIEWVNVVMHNVIGKGQQYNNPLRNVASVFLNLVMHDKPPVIYGTGFQKRVYTPWEDIEFAVMGLILNKRFEALTLNIGPGPEHGLSLNQLFEVVKQVASERLGKKIAIKPKYIDTGVSIPSMKTAFCSDKRFSTYFGKIAFPDYHQTLMEMTNDIMNVERDFDYRIIAQCDLGSERLHSIYRNAELTIAR